MLYQPIIYSASNLITHDTSHILANSASSSNQESYGDGENSYENSGKYSSWDQIVSSLFFIQDTTLDETVIETFSTCFFSSFSSFKIIDSTLCKDKQFAKAFFDTAQKIEIFKALDKFRVKYVRLPIYTMEINIL